jgi:hypothetical protein
MRKLRLFPTCCILSMPVFLILLGCSPKPKIKKLTPQQVALAWAEMALYVTKNTSANSPTYASRCFGYIGVTMYESIVNGYSDYHSLAGQLNELSSLPKPTPNADYDWILSLNAGQASILKKIYNQTSDANKHRIDSLEEVVYEQFSKSVKDPKTISRSIDFGKAIAEAIFVWSQEDGGHRAYLNNFDNKLTWPVKPGAWEPPLYGQSFSHFPLHPHWGRNRTFVKNNAQLIAPEIIQYAAEKESDYCHQFARVYQKSKSLTQEEKEAALWWGDDPSDTFTPPGHSYYLGVRVLKKENPDLIVCAETFAHIGIAVADAFINCWKWKYQFYSERPSSFISKNIDDQWQSFWPDPPFPAFPSGHATQAAAVATVLTDLFGENMLIVDSAHVGRARDELRNVDFKPRTFTSFWQIAEETANSRFYGGIHTPQDNEVGLREGVRMGGNVNLLNWRNDKKSYATLPQK